MTRFRGTALTVTGLLLVVGAAAGCADGQSSETSVEFGRTSGVAADIGDIAMRDTYVYSDNADGVEPGKTAYIRVTILNDGNQPDELVGADPASGHITITAGGGTQSPTTSDAPLPQTTRSFPEGQTGNSSPSAAPTLGVSHSPKPAESVENAPTSSAPPPTTQSTPVTLAPSQVVRFDDPSSGSTGPFMQFTNTTGQLLRTGSTVTVTFTFRDAGSVSVLVPVENPLDTTLSATPVPSPSSPTPTLIIPPGGSPTPSPTETPAEVNISTSPSPSTTVVPVTPTRTP